jgi:hypothetical protein
MMAQLRADWSARSFTGPSTPAQPSQAARITVPLRVRRGL